MKLKSFILFMIIISLSTKLFATDYYINMPITLNVVASSGSANVEFYPTGIPGFASMQAGNTAILFGAQLNEDISNLKYYGNLVITGSTGKSFSLKQMFNVGAVTGLNSTFMNITYVYNGQTYTFQEALNGGTYHTAFTVVLTGGKVIIPVTLWFPTGTKYTSACSLMSKYLYFQVNAV